jgi:hypothetical protein
MWQDPTNDFIDIVAAGFVGGYDIEALHGGPARHAIVIDRGAATFTVVAVTGAGNTRTIVCTQNGEELPAFIRSFTAATDVARIRIFFDG